MARSTSVIATVGASLLVVAIAAAAIRGTDDSGQPSPEPTVAQTVTTGEDVDGTDVTPSPTETASPTEDATTPDDVEAEGTAAPTETDGDQTGTSGDGTDDADTTDDADADGDSGDELPETGGGGLALLGAALAVAGATGGLRHRTT